MTQKVMVKIRRNFAGTATSAMPQAARAFVPAAIPMPAGHAGLVDNAAGTGICTDLFLVLIAVSLIGYISTRLLEPCPETGGRGYSPFSQLSEYTLGWYSAIYYWIYPGITAVTVVYGLIRLIMPE
jgi:hypothetical protein